MSRAAREGIDDQPETMRSVVPTPRFSGIGSSAEPHRPKVFLAHHRDDRLLAEQLAAAVTRYGIEVWFDAWECADSESLVAKMRDGLERTNGSLVLLTQSGIGQTWMGEDSAASISMATEATPHRSRRFLISIVADEPIELPPLLRNRISHAVQDVEGIARSILRHSGMDTEDQPRLGTLWSPTAPLDLELCLSRRGDDITVTTCIRGEQLAGRLRLSPYELLSLRRKVMTQGQVRESNAVAIRSRLTEVGRRLGAVFDGELGTKLTDAIVTQQGLGETLLRFRSEQDELLTLPWETAVWGPTGALGLMRQVTLTRQVEPTKTCQLRTIPGPLRILFGLAIPRTHHEQPLELRSMFEMADATTVAHPRVTFLGEAETTVDRIRERLDADAFHVLHLSVGGSARGLALADPVGVEALAQGLTSVQDPPQLVVLSARSLDVASDGQDLDYLRLARVLVDAGIPQVIAMQGPVADGYASELVSHLYRELAQNSLPCAATALGTTRRAVERERISHATRNEPFPAPVPEFATPVLYAARDCSLRPLFDGTKPIDRDFGTCRRDKRP